ncbi:MAG: LamG-like jellyroll fold domain-containing protein, partial [Planctomycetota bacterium]
MTRNALAVVVILGICGSVSYGWSTPVPVSEVNTQYQEYSPFLSSDGLSLYFARGMTSGYYYFRIFEATRQQPYGPFTSVNQVLSSGGQHVFCPWVSQDNLRMYYFAQTENPILWQLKVSERASANDPWPLGSDISELNALGRLQIPRLTADELTIFFDSPDILGEGSYDLWMASRPDMNSPFDDVTNLAGINTTSNEGGGSVSPDGLTIYFHSDRNGSYHIFKATRQSLAEPFGNVEHLSTFDTPGGHSVHPCISSDGKALYFVRTPTGEPSDIYVSYLIPSPGLIAHWKFDEGNGSIAYDSAGTNDGTIYGAAWTTGQLGGALNFDGVDDYVDMADTVKNYLGRNYTVSAWIKANTISNNKAILSYRHSTEGNPVLFSLGQYYTNVDFAVRDNSHNLAQPAFVDAITTETWYHVAGVREENVLNIYVNGVSGIPDSEAFGAIIPDNLKIGATQWGGNPVSDHFNGAIDDVRIYNRALSAGEVEQLYAYGGENLLVNGDFETMELISGDWPSEYGDWSGDHSYILPRYGDVWPFQGSQLLQFVGTDRFGCSGYAESQVYQIVDVSAFAGDIAAGKATASASAYFNRLAGDAETDAEFSVDIRAFEGDPCSFPALQDASGMHLAEASGFIFTDGDPATWERGEAQLALPANTDYVVVGIHAMENVYNDPCWPEFDGHFADAASLVMVIEPNVPEPEGFYYVDGVNGSDDSNGLTPETAFATVQKGIDTAMDGNTVIVYPAVYDEALLINNKEIKLQGVATSVGIPMLQKASDYAVSFYGAGGSGSLLKNFVIRGSDLGIFIVGGSPTINNVTVVDNVFGIAAYAGATPDISNSIFWNNTDGDLFGDPDPIQALYSFFQDTNGPNMPIAGLVSNWKFDEGSGTTAYDSTGTNDGIIYGATWTAGQIDGALSFDGSNDYVFVPHDTTLDITGDITISVWLYLNEGALYETIVSKCVGSGSENVPYDFRSTLSKLTLVRADASGHERIYSLPRIPLGQWHHCLVRVENKVPDFY